MVKLGYALARAGFVVMFYWSKTLGLETRLEAGEVANFVAAFQHLKGQPYVDRNRMGLAGFSVGASYAMVAAADPRISADIAFINFFGGYYDAADLLVQIAARRVSDENSEVPWQVHELTEKVFTNTLLSSAPSNSRDALLQGTDSIEGARRLYEDMPEEFRKAVAAVSPSSYLGDWNENIAVRVMHDRGDAIVPVGESRRLVAGLRRERPEIKVYYTETDMFQHVISDGNKNCWSLLVGGWHVFRHMYHIIYVARH